MFLKYGSPIIFITRLLPGVRGFVPISAGIAKMNLIQFVVYVFVGSFLWSLFLTYIGFLAGEHWEVAGKYVNKFGLVFVIIFGIVLVWWIWNHIRKRDI